jgi:hypothetical protein
VIDLATLAEVHMKKNLLLVTYLSSFLIRNGSRFRTVSGILPPLLLLLIYAFASVAAFTFLEVDQLGYKIYLYVLLLASAVTLMVCYTIVSNFALRNVASDAPSVIAETTPRVSWRYLEPGMSQSLLAEG